MVPVDGHVAFATPVPQWKPCVSCHCSRNHIVFGIHAQTYKPDLESVNDLYGSPYDYTETDEEEVQTPKRKCAIECPPAPKKGLKRQRSDSMVTQYDSDEDEEQKLLEVHEMNHPKRIKV